MHSNKHVESFQIESSSEIALIPLMCQDQREVTGYNEWSGQCYQAQDSNWVEETTVAEWG